MRTEKIAMFKSVDYDSEVPFGDVLEGSDSHVRITEYVEVEFEELNHQAVTSQEIEILKKDKKVLQANAEVAIGNIDTKISKLLALPSL